MTAFTYDRDLDRPVSAEVEQTIRDVLEGLLSSQGLESVLVNPGLDHDGDPGLFVHLKFRLVEPGIAPRLHSDRPITVRRALCTIGKRPFPHLRYDFHDDQRILGKLNLRVAISSDLITTAWQLAHVNQRRLRQADLLRSISTSYYALFHWLAEQAASPLLGKSSAAQKSAAWLRVYRDVNHLPAQKACSRPELQACAQKLA